MRPLLFLAKSHFVRTAISGIASTASSHVPTNPTPPSRPRLPVLRMDGLQEARCNGSLLYAFTVTAVQSPLMQPKPRHRHPSHCSARKTAGCTQRPAAERTQSMPYLMNGRSEQTTLLFSLPRRQVFSRKKTFGLTWRVRTWTGIIATKERMLVISF